ncbi:MAG: NAD(P)-binding protein [candidate division Zixibacteria bacterium]|nr:NAD(P)-binding protein [candidate division Zixibacteria bacterium]
MYRLETTLKKEKIKLFFPRLSSDVHTISRLEPSSCRVACPAGIQVKAYIGLIVAGKFQEALDLIKKDNPLPGICGRVCTHPCESECNRRKVDESVAICALKRFVADWELKKSVKRAEPIARISDEKIAIVGSGPAGLTCANDLIRLGYGVTVFEKLPFAGGMLTAGIPSYRLPREIINKEIENITDLGVEIRLGVKVGKDVGFDELMEQGFKAFFIAVGAHQGLKLNVPGENDYQGFIDCVDFLRNVNSGDHKKPGRKVIVIGGGNSAIDASRTALRLGCDEVFVVYRRSRKEMPANVSEIEEAEKEGVKIHYLAAPVKILGKKGKVAGMECIKMRLGEPDESGRRKPVPLEGSEFVIEADVIIPSISQKPDLSFLPKDHEFKLSKWDTFEVDPVTFATNIQGFFAGGDAMSGPNTVVDAIAHGHFVARSINRYLKHKDLKKITHSSSEVREWGFRLEIEGEKPIERNHFPKLSIEKRLNSFEEVDLCFTEEQAIAEAKRCLRCGPCVECQECVAGCSKRLVMLSFPHKEAQEIGRVPEFILRVPTDPMKLPRDKRSEEVVISWRDEEEKENQLTLALEPITCFVDKDMCRGCGKCEKVCEYKAITLKPVKEGLVVSEIDESICKGCGTCVAICTTGAIKARHFTDKRIEQMLESCLNQE